ncbi:MAG: CocE/NonD family hydrolase [Planctomycetota bacterium]
MRIQAASSVVLLFVLPVCAQEPTGKEWITAHYTKREVLVPMRDGVKLFTSLYEPKDASAKHPILLKRTPYSCSPYGASAFSDSLGPTALFHDKGYTVAVQDVRGAYMSEGTFLDMRPHLEGKQTPAQTDEASDAFDTIDWLVKNVPNNNGNVGMWGISYPGFYASAGMIDAHPALKAVSPQAPIADWWYDDFHHNGALFLPHAFNFLASFGRPRPEPTSSRSFKLDHGTPDGYRFFLELGSMANVNARWFKGEVAMWNEIVAHPNYDEYWSARNLLPHLKHVAPAVMIVGGWFDAEDLYGALNTYRAIEQQNPGIYNVLVMGPWAHGGWARSDGDRLGDARFGEKSSVHYRKDMELAFFEHFLKSTELPLPAEANVFDTGANVWRSFDAWPPKSVATATLSPFDGFLLPGGQFDGTYYDGYEGEHRRYDEFISDPSHPVPFTDSIAVGMTKEYMTDDQRFVSTRPDVLTYRTPALESEVTLAGPIQAKLQVSTSGTDSDWIVKLIDEFPPDAQEPKDAEALSSGKRLGGFQMLVRSEVMRGRFRNDPARPEPFVPGQETSVNLTLQDVLHTFKPGHRVVIQIHCTWFPLVDRNPQKFVPSIYAAKESDFIPARQRVWLGTQFEIQVLPAPAK